MATQPKIESAFDRLPPQNVDAERSVLGAMLLNNDVVGTAVEILGEHPVQTFYYEAHQHIYDAVLALYRRNVPVDAITLLEQLNRNKKLKEAGGPAYVAELSGAVPTAANVEHYATIVMDMAILRRVITAFTQLAGDAYKLPPNVPEFLDKAEGEVLTIAEQRQLTPIYKVSDLLVDTVHRIEKLIKEKTGITGIESGYFELDQMTSGFQPSDMIVLAARPSVGKTALALNVAAHAAIELGKRVLLFSLEMSKEQLAMRLVCLVGNINAQRLRTGFLASEEFSKVLDASDKLSRAPLYIDDSANISALDLRSKSRRHKHQHGLDMIIIDYLQLMGTPNKTESRQVAIAEISRDIKGLARQLQVPVIALSQLSREAEKDDTGRPRLSHLRESGAIEQDADLVMLLSRPPKGRAGTKPKPDLPRCRQAAQRPHRRRQTALRQEPPAVPKSRRVRPARPSRRPFRPPAEHRRNLQRRRRRNTLLIHCGRGREKARIHKRDARPNSDL